MSPSQPQSKKVCESPMMIMVVMYSKFCIEQSLEEEEVVVGKKRPRQKPMPAVSSLTLIVLIPIKQESLVCSLLLTKMKHETNSRQKESMLPPPPVVLVKPNE